jgi:hypothetical protein
MSSTMSQKDSVVKKSVRLGSLNFCRVTMELQEEKLCPWPSTLLPQSGVARDLVNGPVPGATRDEGRYHWAP